jgi:hypothetical protein
VSSPLSLPNTRIANIHARFREQDAWQVHPVQKRKIKNGGNVVDVVRASLIIICGILRRAQNEASK